MGNSCGQHGVVGFFFMTAVISQWCVHNDKDTIKHHLPIPDPQERLNKWTKMPTLIYKHLAGCVTKHNSSDTFQHHLELTTSFYFLEKKMSLFFGLDPSLQSGAPTSALAVYLLIFFVWNQFSLEFSFPGLILISWILPRSVEVFLSLNQQGRLCSTIIYSLFCSPDQLIISIS